MKDRRLNVKIVNMTTSINDVNSTEEVELQKIIQAILDVILDRVFDSNSSTSNQTEKSHWTGDDPKFRSLKDSEKDEPRLNGTDVKCLRTVKAQNSKISTSLDDIKSTDEMELQVIIQTILDDILDRVFDSNSSISNQVEKSQCTGDDPNFGSLKDPENDELCKKGTDN